MYYYTEYYTPLKLFRNTKKNLNKLTNKMRHIEQFHCLQLIGIIEEVHLFELARQFIHRDELLLNAAVDYAGQF